MSKKSLFDGLCLKAITSEAKDLKKIEKQIVFAAMQGKSAVLTRKISHDNFLNLVSHGFKCSEFQVENDEFTLIEWAETKELDIVDTTITVDYAIKIQKNSEPIINFLETFFQGAKKAAAKGLNSYSEHVEDGRFRHALADYLGTFNTPGCKFSWNGTSLVCDWGEYDNNMPDAKCSCSNCKKNN